MRRFAVSSKRGTRGGVEAREDDVLLRFTNKGVACGPGGVKECGGAGREGRDGDEREIGGSGERFPEGVRGRGGVCFRRDL